MTLSREGTSPQPSTSSVVADTPAERFTSDLTARLGWAGDRVDAAVLRSLASPGSCGGNRPLLLAVALPLGQLEALLIAAENPRKPRPRRIRHLPTSGHHPIEECLERRGKACGNTCESCPSRRPNLATGARDLREAVGIRRAMDLNAWGPSGSPLG